MSPSEITRTNKRPQFTPNEYREHLRLAGEWGIDPWPPTNATEYLILEDLCPRLAKSWRPSDKTLDLMGLPLDYAEDVAPISRRMRRAIIEAMRIDRDFTSAMRQMMEHAQ